MLHARAEENADRSFVLREAAKTTGPEARFHPRVDASKESSKESQHEQNMECTYVRRVTENRVWKVDTLLGVGNENNKSKKNSERSEEVSKTARVALCPIDVFSESFSNSKTKARLDERTRLRFLSRPKQKSRRR